jgi:hypothetical protein
MKWLYVLLIAILGNAAYFTSLYFTIKNLGAEKKGLTSVFIGYLFRFGLTALMLYWVAIIADWPAILIYAAVYLTIKFILTKKNDLYK